MLGTIARSGLRTGVSSANMIANMGVGYAEKTGVITLMNKSMTTIIKIPYIIAKELQLIGIIN